jgi:transcriptional regulator with XRE-family HTH domain
MLDKAELGRRVKMERLAKNMTLKQVADSSGMSPTHISEIERGRTSPTVGALLRIAHALGKSATYFVEENALPTVSVVRRHERQHRAITEGDRSIAEVDFLTSGIPAGRLRVVELKGSGAGEVAGPIHQGEEILLVTAGRLAVIVGDEEFELGEGDCIQFKGSVPHAFRSVGDQEPQAFWVTATEGLLSP